MYIDDFFNSFENVLHNPPTKIPAFQTGYAFIRDECNRPAPPPFPYITYDHIRPDFLQQQNIIVSIWDKRVGNPGWFNLINHVFRQVEEAIPHEGIVLRLCDGKGSIWLQRGAHSFLSYMNDPDDQDIVRGIVNLTVRSYIL